LIKAEVPEACAAAKTTQKDTARELALKTSALAPCEPLETPDQLDGFAKEKTNNYRKAVKGAKEREQAVAVTPASNGTGDFSTELQETSTSPAVTTNTSNTFDATATAPTVNKRKRQVSAPTPTITVAANVSAGPAKKKCQGCIHGDLLEMTVMESCHVKHYLKPGEFLEDASCAGNCNATIKSIYGAAPKAQLHFCDEIIKGFRAPESDLGKADLECGLILCVPCHADRWVKYDQEHSSGGSTIRRSSHRGRNN
jgi:hypothetical protein